MNKIKIRRYRESDNNDVRNLHMLGLSQFNAYLDKKLDKDLDDIGNAYLKNGEFIVGEINNRIAAMGAFKKISGKKAEIKRIRVHPDYQRKGFGQMILDELEKKAAGLGYKILQLETTDRQKPAQKFFEKNGYVKTRAQMLKKYNLKIVYYKKELK